MSKLHEVSLRKMKFKLWLLGFLKIPMLGFVRPKLVLLNEQEVNVKIKLRRRTKNHLNSMYFGALSVGADVTAGIHAFYFAEKKGKKISFAFKSMNASFIKRATTAVTFIFKEGKTIEDLIEKSIHQNERINAPVNVLAFNQQREMVATFTMEISIKVN